MDEAAILQSAFLYIRREFFPRWDRKGSWIVKLDSEDPRDGLCDLDKKEIIIFDIPESQDDLHLLLIHEICHFVSPTHGTKWQTRMFKAADRADQIGKIRLAEAIRKDVEFFKHATKSKLKHVYNAIEDAVLDNPKASFEQIFSYVSRSFRCKPNEMKVMAKRARKVYDQAKKDATDLISDV